MDDIDRLAVWLEHYTIYNSITMLIRERFVKPRFMYASLMNCPI